MIHVTWTDEKMQPTMILNVTTVIEWEGVCMFVASGWQPGS